MKRKHKLTKYSKIKKSFKIRINRHPYCIKSQISKKDFSEDGLLKLFKYYCAIFNTDRIALCIGNFENNRAPIYVRRK